MFTADLDNIIRNMMYLIWVNIILVTKFQSHAQLCSNSWLPTPLKWQWEHFKLFWKKLTWEVGGGLVVTTALFKHLPPLLYAEVHWQLLLQQIRNHFLLKQQKSVHSFFCEYGWMEDSGSINAFTKFWSPLIVFHFGARLLLQLLPLFSS